MIDLNTLREFAKEGKPMQLADIQNHEIIKLINMLEEAQKDADRYRWLRNEGRYNGFRVESGSNGWMKTHSASTLDEAIDAAIKAKD